MDVRVRVPLVMNGNYKLEVVINHRIEIVDCSRTDCSSIVCRTIVFVGTKVDGSITISNSTTVVRTIDIMNLDLRVRSMD